MQDARSNPMIEAGTDVAPSPACDGGQLLLWPDVYDPEQSWDSSPFDTPNSNCDTSQFSLCKIHDFNDVSESSFIPVLNFFCEVQDER